MPQIALPNKTVSCTKTAAPVCEIKTPETPEQDKPAVVKSNKAEKPKKEKKPKEEAVEPSVDIGRLDLRIAQVLEVQRHPDADTLYLLKINCGEEKPRTVCSGLVKHIQLEELQNRKVMLLCNLKPVKVSFT